MRIFLLWITLILVGCKAAIPPSGSNDSLQNAGSRDTPSVLEFDLKNGEGDALAVRYLNGKLLVTEQVGQKTAAYDRTPTEDDWNSFWVSLGKIQI